MAKVLDSPAVPPFSVSDHRTLAQRWGKWTKSLDYYLCASGVTDQKQKRAVLLHFAGSDVREIVESLPNTGDDYMTALEKFNDKTCVFGEQTDEAIRDQAIDKCVSKELRRRLLREPDIDLSKLLTTSRALEQSHFQAQEMEQPFTQPSDSINAIRPRYNTENSGVSRRETPSHINTGASRGASNSSLYNQSKEEFTRWRSQPCY
ncbi:Hypothetical predicted protein [Paramuricea clavata]|uniref:Uncharacterized protein n=1 Tax=Paramuricea clavata TaxID=317549 RepID=A0A7D9JPY9_PARCT|nr:Hypothetical predicted protein [Paramuricea clavata]